jgi:hypothetical protein
VAYEENVSYTSSRNAGADLSAAANQFRAVKLDSAGAVVAATNAAADIVIGVLSNKPKSGERAKVASLTPGSVLKVRIGASQSIAIGDKLVCGSGGDFVEGTTNDYSSFVALSAVTTGGGESAIIPAKVISTIKL